MSSDSQHVYALDIKTSTEPVIGPDGEPGYIPGLDPLRGFITEIGIATGEKATSMAFCGEEASLLESCDWHLAHLQPGLIVTWNGSCFDMPFIHTRIEEIEQGPSAPLIGLTIAHDDTLTPKYDPLPGHGPDVPGLDGRTGHTGAYSATWSTRRGRPHTHLDISFGYKAYAEEHGIKWGLKPVAEHLGIECITVDREQMHHLTPEEREAYVLSDVNATRRLALRLLGHHDWMGI